MISSPVDAFHSLIVLSCDPEAIIESYAGSGAWSVYRELDFQGRHDLIVDSTDAKTNSDDWLIAVFAAHSTGLVSNRPFKGPFVLLAGVDPFAILVQGRRGYKVYIENRDVTKNDVVAADIYTQEGLPT